MNSFPSADELTDLELSKKLWELIYDLARRRTFLCNTEHLSDRTLYARLLAETLAENPSSLSGDQYIDFSDCYLDLRSKGTTFTGDVWPVFPRDHFLPDGGLDLKKRPTK